MPVVNAPEGHSRLSPSSMTRILACPGSAVLDEDESTSEAAEEGTFGHALATEWLALGKEPPPDTDPELVEAIEQYVEYVKGQPSYRNRLLEFRIISDTIPDFGGTMDCLLVGDDSLHVVDLKLGRYAVEAEANDQLKSYLCLAREKFPTRDGLFAGSIVQPRVKSPQYVEFTAEELDEHLVRIAMAEGDDSRHAGTHCKWCPLLLACEENRQWVQRAAAETFADDDSPTIERCLEIIDLEPVVSDAAKQAKKLLVKRALNGEKIPGFKPVQKLSNRQWISELQVVQALTKAGLGDEDLYDKKLRSPAKVEKKAGKKVVAKLCERVPTGIILAPDSSKLPEYVPSGDMFPDDLE